MFLAAFFCRFYRVLVDFSFLHLLDNCFVFCFSFYLISRNMFMFIGCFIHSFWTCGNQNQQCNYTFCCLHGAGSGQMLWWWQQPSWNISTSLLALLNSYFSPFGNFPLHKASFSASLPFVVKKQGETHVNDFLTLSCFFKPLHKNCWGFLLLRLLFFRFILVVINTTTNFCSSNRLSTCSIFHFLMPYNHSLLNKDKQQEQVICTTVPGQLLL